MGWFFMLYGKRFCLSLYRICCCCCAQKQVRRRPGIFVEKFEDDNEPMPPSPRKDITHIAPPPEEPTAFGTMLPRNPSENWGSPDEDQQNTIGGPDFQNLDSANFMNQFEVTGGEEVEDFLAELLAGRVSGQQPIGFVESEGPHDI